MTMNKATWSKVLLGSAGALALFSSVSLTPQPAFATNCNTAGGYPNGGNTLGGTNGTGNGGIGAIVCTDNTISGTSSLRDNGNGIAGSGAILQNNIVGTGSSDAFRGN